MAFVGKSRIFGIILGERMGSWFSQFYPQQETAEHPGFFHENPGNFLPNPGFLGQFPPAHNPEGGRSQFWAFPGNFFPKSPRFPPKPVGRAFAMVAKRSDGNSLASECVKSKDGDEEIIKVPQILGFPCGILGIKRGFFGGI